MRSENNQIFKQTDPWVPVKTTYPIVNYIFKRFLNQLKLIHKNIE